MLWLSISVFFSWCAYREIRNSIVPPPGFDFPSSINKSYLSVVLIAAVLCGWPPLHTWRFQRFLSEKATVLADNHRATVHCNTIFDTMMDSEMLASGHADPRTGKIGIQHPWCGTLMSYLRHPERATEDEIFSLDMFTHESMHIRGELDEARTECQAVQRNYRAARMLGVPDVIAKRNALAYYTGYYRRRAAYGPMQRQYYSDDCAPGKAWDEHLSDSSWGP
jgi:hypothetical protein